MYSNEDKEKVRSLSKQSHSLRQIAEMTGIPKSSVADLIRAAIQPSTVINALQELDEECPASNDRPLHAESDTYSADLRTISGQNRDEYRSMSDESDNFRTIPGQIYGNRTVNTYEPDDNWTNPVQINDKITIPAVETPAIEKNRTVPVPEQVSPGWIEVQKLNIQLTHDREMRKMDQVDAQSSLQQKENAEKKQVADKVKAINVERADDFSFRFMMLANILLNKGDEHEWDSQETEDLYDTVSILLDEFTFFCKKNGIYFKASEPYNLLKWLKKGIGSLMDNYDEGDVFFVTYKKVEKNLIGRAINFSIARML